MKESELEKKIKDLIKDKIIVERINLEKSIYIYSKEKEDQKFAGPPLYVNKETGDYKFLYVADVINDHQDLKDYFDSNND
ncbi:hypothetical protein [Aquimarina latercula]|uniref:hypothetical protein n=1 Tax=Aquimarina latercula TaxID=987 RepID=UPI000423FF51|nr:hypothetical protein [Aquimarina latercula]